MATLMMESQQRRSMVRRAWKAQAQAQVQVEEQVQVRFTYATWLSLVAWRQIKRFALR